MRKLTLRLDDLSVESFDTSVVREEKGTVFGEQQCTCQTACTCPGCDTCDATCRYTCDDRTCDGQLTCDPTCAFTCGYESCHPVDCGQSYEYAFCQQYP
jgi:hypothetical protein